MLRLQHVEPEYVYSSQKSFSGEDLSKTNSNFFMIELKCKQAVVIEEIQSDKDVVGSVDESDFKFELDINKMRVGQKYIFDYDESKYMAVKNKDGDLELSEIEIIDEG